MTRDPRYDILFEPVKIGPVTAKNRFYQVPHCNGMGHRYPSTTAGMRKMKAEGGWGVICTEECEIHPKTDVSPHNEARLWNDDDIPQLKRMTDAVHEYGALAGLELVFQGHDTPNRYSREVPMGVSNLICSTLDPVQAYKMDKTDIKNVRRMYRNAAILGKQAGFDIIYAYAGHQLAMPMHFMSRRMNDRTDEYGGSLENRVRFFREIIEDAKDAVGDTCAIAIRLGVDELMGADGITAQDEGRDIVEMLAELPDLWDVNISGWNNDSETSRFGEEGFQEPYISFVKSVTTKPVVGVGRFTSPDTMVSQIKRGVMDMIGAARPSIADPFIPNKIEQGHVDDIRECIGCNICVSGDNTVTPMRCTQNPTMGEEWRKEWHPEIIQPKKSDNRILVVGAGPAGLECTHALGKRGYEVVLAEGGTELGGRVSKESRLPGLSKWARVRDYRLGQIETMTNVEVYLDSQMDAEHIDDFGADHVVLATGSYWRKDGIGRSLYKAVPGCDGGNVYSPDDLMNGVEVKGPVVIFDDDNYYMAGVLAELLRAQGQDVTYVTAQGVVSAWTEQTLEQERIQKRLIELGVDIIVSHTLAGIHGDHVDIECVFSGRTRELAASSVVPVTMRLPNEELYLGIKDDHAVTRIGDALAPALIAHAVYAGHRFAREFDEGDLGDVPFKRELVELGEF